MRDRARASSDGQETRPTRDDIPEPAHTRPARARGLWGTPGDTRASASARAPAVGCRQGRPYRGTPAV
eukprot:699992-Pleurochrysis_carterae.AAC.1